MAEINIEKMAHNVAEKAIQELRDNGVFVSRWIPVSERLPEEKQRILITRKSGTIGYIIWNTWWHEQTTYYTDKVIAWMPLPKPYEPQESEGT